MLGSRTKRLPGDIRSYRAESDWIDMLASVPWFFVGLAGIGWEWVVSQMDGMGVMRSR